MDEEEKVLESIRDEGFDLISRSASEEELSNFFDNSLKKLSKPYFIAQSEEYKLALKELNEILH